jgi:hypothetical protein
MKKLTTLLFFSAVITIFLGGLEIKAQELEVTPGNISFTANPGSSQTQQILVRNKGNTEESFIFYLGDWLTDEMGEVQYFDPGTMPRSCADWITVSPNLVTLQPNEQAAINVTMLVPEDDNSTKWAVIFVESAREQTGPEAVDKEVQMGMQLSLRIAVPVYQSPASNTLYNGTLEGLTETINEDGTRTYETQIINLGDKILNCKVYFTASNLETAKEYTSDPISFSLLPETNKNVKHTFEPPFEKGRYSVAAILDYGYNDQLDGIQLDIEVK